jgi:hypothetical protein
MASAGRPRRQEPQSRLGRAIGAKLATQQVMKRHLLAEVVVHVVDGRGRGERLDEAARARDVKEQAEVSDLRERRALLERLAVQVDVLGVEDGNRLLHLGASDGLERLEEQVLAKQIVEVGHGS